MRENYKKWILKTSAVFIAILLMLTFFSNTIHSFGLPCVTVDYANSGIIKNTAVGEGIAEFMETQAYYAEYRGMIELFATEGDIVEAGDRLYTIHTEQDALKSVLESKQNEYDRAVLRIQKLTYDKTYTQDIIDNTAVEYSEPDFSSYDTELNNLQQEIDTTAGELETLRILYESGAISLNELTSKQRGLEKLNDAFEQALLKKQQAADNAIKTEEAAIEAYNEKIKSLQKSLDDMDYQLKEYIMDKNRIEKEMSEVRRQIEDGGIIVVTAETGGKVISALNMDSRNYVDLNSFIIKLGIVDANYYSILRFPESVDFIFIDDEITLEIKAKRLYNIIGQVKETYIDGGYLYVKAEFSAERMNGGEIVSARAEEVSRQFPNVIPNTAVMYDPREGYYLLYVEKIKTLFGNDYYARKTPINIMLQDTINTAYSSFSGDKLTIITNSDKVVSANDRIRLVDGSDIVETR